MRLVKLSDKVQFGFCKVRSLKSFSGRGFKVVPGDTIYAMWYPHKKWSLFLKFAEELDAANPVFNPELSPDAVLGVDFEEIPEVI